MTWFQRMRRERIVALATAFALACSGGSDGPSGNTGSIQVAVNPATLTLQQGASGSVSASLTRSGGFTGVVTLAVTGLPTGVTATVTPTQLSGTTASATVNVTVAATVAPQTYSATITATAQGVAQATATYQLTVTALPNYALSVAPAAITIQAGASGGATVNIDRTNFTGAVALALASPPAGITGVFNPTPATANSSMLQISVATSVAAGSYPVTIQGTATGFGAKTTTLTVTVTAPPAGNVNVEYRYCDASQVPAFFAYQDGNGAWQSVTASTTAGVTKFAFTLTQGRGGVLVVLQTEASAVADVMLVGRSRKSRQSLEQLLRVRDGIRGRFTAAPGRPGVALRSVANAYETDVLYASATELAQDGIDNCAVSQPTKTVTGTVAGITAGQYGILSLGSSTVVFDGAATTNPVTFDDVPAGPVDFVATRMTSPGTPPDKVVVLRDLNIPDGGSLPSTINFAAPAATPATATATITGASSGDDLEIFTELVTAKHRLLFWFDLAPSQVATRPWAGLSAANMVSGDFHDVVVFATPRASEGDYRVSLKYVGPVANQTLAIGPVLAAPTISSVATGAYPRFRFQGALPSEYNKGASIDVLSSASAGNVFSIIASGAYLAASGNALAYDLTMPNVAGLTGFPGGARLTAGPNDITASGFGFTGPGIFDLQPNVGSEFKAAAKAATVVVP